MTPENSTPSRTTLKPCAAIQSASFAVKPAAVAGGTYGARFQTAFTPCSTTTLPWASTRKRPSRCSATGVGDAVPVGTASTAASSSERARRRRTRQGSTPSNRLLLPKELNRCRTQHMKSSVEVRGLVVVRGRTEVLHGLDFALEPSRVTGLL